MVHPRVSKCATDGGWRLVEVVEVVVVVGADGAVGAGAAGGAAGGATNADSRARASNAHPPTAVAATTSAARARRRPRRGSCSPGTVIGGRDNPRLYGSHPAPTTPHKGTPRRSANSAGTPSAPRTSTP